MDCECDLSRRLYRIRQRPNMHNYPDEMLTSVLIESSDFFEEYCHTTDPGREVDSLITDIALMRVNRIGAEGASKVKEGGLDRDYAEDIPLSIRSRLNSYRRVILRWRDCATGGGSCTATRPSPRPPATDP